MTGKRCTTNCRMIIPSFTLCAHRFHTRPISHLRTAMVRTAIHNRAQELFVVMHDDVVICAESLRVSGAPRQAFNIECNPSFICWISVSTCSVRTSSNSAQNNRICPSWMCPASLACNASASIGSTGVPGLAKLIITAFLERLLIRFCIAAATCLQTCPRSLSASAFRCLFGTSHYTDIVCYLFAFVRVAAVACLLCL